MADRKVITCKHCGAEHFVHATRCPRCGRPTAASLPPQPTGRDRMMRGSDMKRAAKPATPDSLQEPETQEGSNLPQEE